MKSLSTLQIALGVSIAVHAALLTVRLVDPERFNRAFKDMPLEVILVNAKSDEKPDKANAIAQASLAGGGAVQEGRASSPLPPSALVKLGDAQEEDAQQQMASFKAQQTQLLLQAEQALAAMPPTDLSMPATTLAQTEHEERSKQRVKLLAEIEKRLNEESERPKKRYISPATREDVYALYYDALRHRIEEKGTQNFPQTAGEKLYGELTMTMTINADGQVLDTQVVQSSGNPMLDRRAQNIVRSSNPFARFSPAMRSKAEQIVVASSFNFARSDSLQTKITSR